MTISLLGSGSETLASDFESAGIEYIRNSPPVGVIMGNAGDSIQIIKGVSDAIPWGSIAAVLVAWLKYRPSKKVIITQESNEICHVEGLARKKLHSFYRTVKT